jgi:quercetin dioxygenase-like cupin family protein
MEKTMKRLAVVILIPLLHIAGYSFAQQKVEVKGVTSKTKLEETVSGHLTELNGKYKLRVTEIVLEPGGFVGEHHHTGPGIRFVVSGELQFVQAGKTTVYKAGDYYYESGDVTHSGHNKSTQPILIISFEVLPADWKGGATIPAKPR